VVIEQLNRSIEFNMEVNSCKFEMSYGIEKYETSQQLFGYQWGKVEALSLFGVASIRYVTTEYSRSTQSFRLY